MWNPNETVTNSHEENDSWEVKAFAKDSANVNGTTWPPQSYNCTFCWREFRSAQALGGHMNVHRRDRARLHQPHPNFIFPNISSSPKMEYFQTEKPVVSPSANGGLCLLCSFPNSNALLITPSSSHNGISIPTSLLSFPHRRNQKVSLDKKRKKTDSTVEGIDLELRLGCSSPDS